MYYTAFLTRQYTAFEQVCVEFLCCCYRKPVFLVLTTPIAYIIVLNYQHSAVPACTRVPTMVYRQYEHIVQQLD